MKNVKRSKILSILLCLVILAAACPLSALADPLPLKKLSCLDGIYPQRCYFTENGLLYVHDWVEDEKTGEWSNLYFLVDPDADKIVAQTTMQDWLEYVGTRENGDVVFWKIEEQDVYVVVLDSSLKVKTTFAIDSWHLYFDAEQDCLFVTDYDKFLRVDFDGKSTPVMNNVLVETFDPAKQMLVMCDTHVLLNRDIVKGFGVYSLKENRFLFGSFEGRYKYHLQDDRLLYEDLVQYGGDNADAQTTITVYRMDGTPEHRWDLYDRPEYFPGAPVISMDRTEWSSDSSSHLGIDLVEVKTGRTIFLPDFNLESENYDPLRNCLLVSKYDGVESIYLLDCTKLAYTDTLVSQPLPEPATSVPFSLGDVDKNGKADAADARLALRIAVGLEPEIEADVDAFDAANVTAISENEVNAADARLILRKAVGFEDEEFGQW